MFVCFGGHFAFTAEVYFAFVDNVGKETKTTATRASMKFVKGCGMAVGVALLACLLVLQSSLVLAAPQWNVGENPQILHNFERSESSPRIFTRNMNTLLGEEQTSEEDPLRVAGYFKLDRTYDAHMFFFHFQSRTDVDSTDPVVVWMTGGPGCSSELAVFYENGPFHINDDLSLKVTEYEPSSVK